MENSGRETKGFRFFIGSIRGRIVLMGSLAVVVAMCLGITGMSAVSSSNKNNRIQTDMLKINALQNDNQAKNLDFLYNMDTSCYGAVVSNLKKMQEYADDAAGSSGRDLRADLEDISAKVKEAYDNSVVVSDSFAARGFTAKEGMYKNFTDCDKEITDFADGLPKQSDMISGAWLYGYLRDAAGVFSRTEYTTDITGYTMREYIDITIGSYGYYYGRAYMTNLCVNGQPVSLEQLTDADLSGSSLNYGVAAVDTYDGMPAIAWEAYYDGVSWASDQIRLPSGKLSDCTSLSFDLYLENTGEEVEIILCGNFSGKAEPAAGLADINEKFAAYSVTVAEGKDAAGKASEIEALLKELRDNMAYYGEEASDNEALMALVQAKLNKFSDIVALDSRIYELRSKNVALSDELSGQTAAVTDKVDAAMERQQVSIRSIIIVVLAVSVVIVALLFVTSVKSVQGSVAEFNHTLSALAEGNMTVSARTGRGGEFDEFGHSLNHMSKTLRTTLGGVRTVTGELALSGENLSHISASANDVSAHVDAAVADISRGAESQAKDLEVSSNHTAKLEGLMKDMIFQAERLNSDADDMEKNGREVSAILTELETSNSNMTDGIRRIVNTISTTDESVKKIAATVSLISDIAAQTNLLSLNASIEAARAGDAGRGFAVVAEEISKLANQSNESAATIGKVIQTLTADFKEAMETVADVENVTARQNEKLAQTVECFGSLISDVGQAKEKAESIWEASRECDASRKDISDIMLNLLSISEENAAASRETASSMDELNRIILAQNEESRKLKEISDTLSRDMEFFRL